MEQNFKISRYNISCKVDDSVVLFNTLSGGMIQLSDSLLARYEELASDISALQKEQPAFYNALSMARFIVPLETDELSYVRFRNYRDIFLNSTYGLTINPTMDCNFGCWYCYETHVPGRMTDEICARIIKHVKNLYEKRSISGLALSWFGGEPLMYFDKVVFPMSIELMQMSEAYGCTFTHGMTTNGYLLDATRIEKMIKIGLNHLQITLDGGQKNHDSSRQLKSGKPTFDKIISNITQYLEMNLTAHVTLRINYNDKALNDVHEIKSIFKEDIRNRIHVDFHRIWQTYNEEILLNDKLTDLTEEFRAAGLSMNSHAFHLYNGNKCYADRWHQAVINYDGNVFKCTARDFIPNNADGFLNIDGEIEWNMEKITPRFSIGRFENPTCLDCKILPICMGPCSQKVVDNDVANIDQICPLKLIEIGVDDFIHARYRELQAEMVELK